MTTPSRLSKCLLQTILKPRQQLVLHPYQIHSRRAFSLASGRKNEGYSVVFPGLEDGFVAENPKPSVKRDVLKDSLQRKKPQKKSKAVSNTGGTAAPATNAGGTKQPRTRVLPDSAGQKIAASSKHVPNEVPASVESSQALSDDEANINKKPLVSRRGKRPSATLTTKEEPKGPPKRPPAYGKTEDWQIQKEALKHKFKEEGWNPRKKLSPDTLEGVRTLHEQYPERYTTSVLANEFKVSPEAIRRILRSKWKPDLETVEERRVRWARRHDRIWDAKAELGLRPPRTKPREVEDPDAFGEELAKRQVLASR